MKEYNCPDCERSVCEDCSRLIPVQKVSFVPDYFPDSITWPKEQYISPACKVCSNHTKNGGYGICHCWHGLVKE